MLPVSPLLKPPQVDGVGPGGAAPDDAPFVVASATSALSAERVLTGTSNQIVITDNGANSTIVVSTPQDIATSSSPTFAGLTLDGTNEILNVTSDITGFGSSNVFGSEMTFTLSPAADVTTPQVIAGLEFNFTVSDTNTHDISAAGTSAAEFFWSNLGSGDVVNGFAIFAQAVNAGGGAITSELGAIYFNSTNQSAGGVTGTAFKDGNFGCAGQSGSSVGTVARDYTFYAESPLHSGTLTKHWGLFMEDQEFGTESWAIQTTGGKVEFGASTGKNSLLYLSDNDVAHGMTSLFPTNVYGVSTSLSDTAGGLRLVGLSDTDAIPFQCEGVIGSPTPSSTTAAFNFSGSKKNGTGRQDLDSTDLLFQVGNNGTSLLTIRGSGLVEVQSAVSSAFGFLVPGGVFNVDDTGAMLTTTLDITGHLALGIGSTLSFFGAPLASQQTGGAATAGIIYGGTEQAMLQKAYDALRTFGLLS